MTARTLASPALALFVACLFAACPREGGEASAGAPAETAVATASAEGEAPLPRVADDNPNLLFSFVDRHGEVRAVSRVDEVPKSARPRVVVVDLSLTPEQRQAHRYAFFADLTTKGPDGAYPVTVVSRYNAAKGEGQGALLPPVPEGAVIVYSAEWCGFCKKAKRWLADKDVPFVERDVEKQPGAAKELQAKLAEAGVRGGGVPVIDWEGTLVMGFDRDKLSRLLEGRRQPGSAKEAGR